MLMNTLRAIIIGFCGVSGASAAIFAGLPPAGSRSVPTESVTYDTLAVEGGTVITLDIGGVFSFDAFGNIPPNETRVVDVGAMLGNPGGAYVVNGLGWDVELDAYVPSWLSDASIAFGDDPDYLDVGLTLVPGMGDDFAGLMSYSSNGIVDLTDIPGQGNTSLSLSEGVLYLQFFETFVDYGGGVPDAQWQPGSNLSIQVVPVPEGSGMMLVIFALAAGIRVARSKFSAMICASSAVKACSSASLGSPHRSDCMALRCRQEAAEFHSCKSS